jgi:hypothetical protein
MSSPCSRDGTSLADIERDLESPAAAAASWDPRGSPDTPSSDKLLSSLEPDDRPAAIPSPWFTRNSSLESIV